MKALGFDTETTDLIRNRHRPLNLLPHITEFFGLILEDKPKPVKAAKATSKKPKVEPEPWTEVGTFSSLFNPGISLDPKITQITGLTDAMLKNEPPFVKHAKAIKELIESSDIVFAHNFSFDRDMVEIEMERAGLKIVWPKRCICTVEATEHFKSRRLRLMELHEFLFDEPFEGAHRAENDVRPMTRCFIELWKRGVL